ncbi:MAG: hypothetical protein ACLU4J_11575 [Butyricimonas paravirosa]
MRYNTIINKWSILTEQCHKTFICLVSVVVMFFSAGCDDFLDVAPSSSVSIPTFIEDYENMLYPFYLKYNANPILAVMGMMFTGLRVSTIAGPGMNSSGGHIYGAMRYTTRR